MADRLDLQSKGIPAINDAGTRGHALVLGYVDEDDKPSVSFRGSTHVFSPTQLAIWARKRDEGFAKAIEHNPNVTMLFYEREGPGPRYLSFSGRAHVDPAANDAVYDGMIEGERAQDPDRGGVAVIVDVDAVNGHDGQAGFRMERDAQ